MLCELVLLACSNNMNTESCFSRMKFAETTYQSNFNCETYDSIRIIQEVFDRESFESCEFAEELYASIENYKKHYKKITKDTVVENSKKRSIAEQLRQDLLVFKRHSPRQLKAKTDDVDSTIADAENQLEVLKKKKLENEKNAEVARADIISAYVISQMF